MIGHPDFPPEADKAFVFAELGGFTCSICVPGAWKAERVVEFAEQHYPSSGAARWHSVDKSKLGLGSKTPNPCNKTPVRMHYFMMRGE